MLKIDSPLLNIDIPTKDNKNILIYGYNGYGKTTISRIFSEISGKTDKDFIKNNTKIEFNSYKQDLSQQIIRYSKKIFVFNRDYTESIISIPNISKTEQQGLAIGDDSKILQNKREKAQDSYRQYQDINNYSKKIKYDTFKNDINKIDNQLKNYLTETARKIKTSYPLLDTSYDIAKFKTDVGKESNDLTENKAKEVYEIIKNNKEHFLFKNHDITTITGLLEKITKYLAQIPPKTENIIIEKDDFEWIKAAFAKHDILNHDSIKCKFCDGDYTKERFAKLEAKLKDEESVLRNNIAIAIKQITDHKIIYNNGLSVVNQELKIDNSVSVLYGNKTIEEYNAILAKIIEQNNKYLKNKDDIIAILKNKLLDIYNDNIKISNDLSDNIDEIIKLYNDLKDIFDNSQAEHKKIIAEIAENKKKLLVFFAKNEASSSDFINKIAEYRQSAKKLANHYGITPEDCTDTLLCHNIDFDELLKPITEQHNIAINIITTYEKSISAKINTNKADEKTLNANITTLLGENRFTVKEDKTDQENVNYTIVRSDGTEITDPDSLRKFLSEGEKTAIAFAYFMAKIKSYNDNIKDSILVVDDPICSLDDNILYRVFNQILKFKNQFLQTIILTHNHYFADCFYKTKEYVCYMMIKKDNKTTLCANSMAISMKSEYKFLFKAVYDFSNGNFENQFVIGNIMRKLNEAFFKMKFACSPDDYKNSNTNFKSYISTLTSHIKYQESKNLFSRFTNDTSHSDVIEKVEIQNNQVKQDVAKAILENIKNIDPDHYEAYKKSIEPKKMILTNQTI
jgi:wobble nucleotide-excising tRNase